MSAGPAFFQSPAVRALLARASRAAGMPVAVHFVMDGHEGPRIAAHGGCAACAHIAAISGGRARCRASRSANSARALRQGRALTDTCHLGFGVLSLPALPGEAYALTFGPFAPAGDDAALKHDALEGLADLSGERHTEFPVSLDDIHRTPPGSVLAIAEWTVDELARLWSEASLDKPTQSDAAEPGKVPATKPAPATSSPIGTPVALATAIAGGHRKRLRAILTDFAAEAVAEAGEATQSGPRLLGLLPEAIAACNRAGIDTAAAAAMLPDAAVALPRAPDPAAAVDCAFRVLAVLTNQPGTRLKPVLQAYRPLDKLVAARMPAALPLEEAAQAIGKSPAAVSMHLQRSFGINYSAYVALHRVERAKRYLRDTQLSAAAIGVRVGIDDSSDFGRTFRRIIGMTPLDYRRRVSL